MFFILSKILQYFLTPLVWIFILIIVSVISKNKKDRKKLWIIAFSFLFFFTNPFIQDEFMRSWEIEAVHVSDLNESYDYGIVLAGMLTYDNHFERINFLRPADRILQTIDLYHRGIIKKIFITGGSGEILNQRDKESVILRDYLIKTGIPEEDILIESESRNTYENAVNSAKILNPQNNDNTYLLITSAFHMRRAGSCFIRQGFEFDVFVADRYAGPRKYTPNHLIIPCAVTLARWTLLIREVSGFIIYKSIGYA